jgi:hypothetical protein
VPAEPYPTTPGAQASTFLGVVGLGTRVTIGQESRARLIEKFFAAGHLMPPDFKKPRSPSRASPSVAMVSSSTG